MAFDLENIITGAKEALAAVGDILEEAVMYARYNKVRVGMALAPLPAAAYVAPVAIVAAACGENSADTSPEQTCGNSSVYGMHLWVADCDSGFFFREDCIVGQDNEDDPGYFFENEQKDNKAGASYVGIGMDMTQLMPPAGYATSWDILFVCPDPDYSMVPDSDRKTRVLRLMAMFGGYDMNDDCAKPIETFSSNEVEGRQGRPLVAVDEPWSGEDACETRLDPSK